MDEPTTMNDKLIKLGVEHAQKHGVNSNHFSHFRTAFMKTMKKRMKNEPSWNARSEQAWEAFWNRIIFKMNYGTQTKILPAFEQYDGRTLSIQEMLKFKDCIYATFNIALDQAQDAFTFAEQIYKSLLEQQDIADIFEEKKTNIEAHTVIFIQKLTRLIKLFMHDTAVFTVELETLSATHVEHGVSTNILRSFGEIIVSKIKSSNIEYCNEQTQKWTQQHDDAWKWFWNVVVGIMSKRVGIIQKSKKDRID